MYGRDGHHLLVSADDSLAYRTVPDGVFVHYPRHTAGLLPRSIISINTLRIFRSGCVSGTAILYVIAVEVAFQLVDESAAGVTYLIVE